MEKEFYTVKEYAEIKGISVQAVYKKLNGTLKPFVEVVEGRKVLKREVLEEAPSTNSTNVKFNVEQPFSTEGLTSSSLDAEILRINRRNEELIDDLRAQLKEKDAQIKEMNEKVVSLFETNQRLLENNQSLQLNYQMLLGNGTDKAQEVVNIDAEEEGAQIQDEEVEEKPIEQEEEQPEKKSFLYWLFH